MQNEVPSVLAVLVVKDGAAWLKRVLASLARQTHPRFGVLAVDNASQDDSAEILEQVLGRKRVVRLNENVGFPAAVQRALSIPAAQEAEFVLLLHDDTLLSPETVTHLVDAAGRLPGSGVVGPKVLDWEDPSILREVGFATDRFGNPYSPLEDGEIDQGQYDAPREVLFVSSAAMLVSRAAWTRTGAPDERLPSSHGDLDFCWRVRLAGFRVLVAPRAVVRHRSAGARDERPHTASPGDLSERVGLMSLLKNYRLITLLWILPVHAVVGLARLVGYLFSRRLDRAGEVLKAWGWNLAHLPGTIRRRARAQAVRRVPDREIAKFMSSAGARLSRRALQASSVLVGTRAGSVEPGDELEAEPLHQRVASLVVTHPVAIGLIAAAVITLISFRGVLFVPRIEGGALPVFPSDAADFFREFAAGWRSTGFGGTEGTSPALVPLGVGSFLALGDPELLERLLVGLAPLLAAVSCYRALRRLGVPGISGVTAAACYALSALAMWAVSEGRIATLALLVALPWLAARFAVSFAGPARPWRWIVGTGMGLAATAAFFPAVWMAAALVLVPLVALPDRGGKRTRGLGIALASAVVAGVLLFPFTVHLVTAGGGASLEAAGRPAFSDLLRLSPGPAPGSWLPALFLPLAGVISFALAEGEARRPAWRAMATAAIGAPLAWLTAAGHLPSQVSNPVAILAAVDFSLCLLVGLGIRSLVPGARRVAFGSRQLAAGGLVVVVGLGLALQSVQAMGAGWGVGEERLSPAWPVVSSSDPGAPFRVLWLGPPNGEPLPPPGGDPNGVASAGDAAVAYGVTGRHGRSALAIGLPASGDVYRYLERSLSAMLTGDVRHGGALLAPFGIRFVVVRGEGLSGEAGTHLAGQVDLDLIQQAGGLSIYRNARALPEAAVVPGAAAVETARDTSLLAPLSLDAATAGTLAQQGTGWRGSAAGTEPSLVNVAAAFSPQWDLRTESGEEVKPFPAFGWGLGFEAPPGGLSVGFDGRARRALEVAAIAVLWAAALWVVRRSPREEQSVPARESSRATARRPVERSRT